MVYYKKYLGYLKRKIFSEVRWGYVIFFVTNKCNSRCRHCFYWKDLNKGGEMNLEEIEKITKNIGGVEVLLLSGGEPFLRKDLFEIISFFIKNNSAKVVSIPTNALDTKKIIGTTIRLLEQFPNVTFSINPSIDGLYEKNEEFRGIKNSFEKSIKTLKRLEKIKKKYKNLDIVINTTISNLNYKDIDEIIEFFKNFDITYHNFELLRGNPKEKSINLPSLSEIREIHPKIIRLRNFYINKNKKYSGFEKLLERTSVLGVTKYTQILKERVLDNKGFPFICSAGKNIFVLEPNGDLKLCELHPAVGNLRDYEYDVEKLLKNKRAKQMFEAVKKCRCTHICFLNMSIANDKKSLIKIPYYFLKWKS